MNSQHGGKRSGAGRKSIFNEPTRVVRLPESQVAPALDFVRARAMATRDAASLRFAIPTYPAGRVELPLFATGVRAGFPSPADDYIEHRLDLNDLVQHKEATYYAWVEGDSMVDLNIHDGDLMMIDKAVEPEMGDIVVAEVDGQFTVKRLGERGGVPCLLPGNPSYPVIVINPDIGITIWGVVVRLIHDMRQRRPRRKL
jgi:DNA polymerase V